MRRIAAHYIWYKEVLRLHYVEVSDQGVFSGVFPLEEETANTSFVNGVILPFPINLTNDLSEAISNWPELTKTLSSGAQCQLFHITGLSPSNSKIGVFETPARFDKL